MSTIDFKGMQEEFLGNQPFALEPLNVGLIVRIQGEDKDGLPNQPEVTPKKVRGMLDIARAYRPSICVKLKDANGEEREQRIPYFEGVKSGSELVGNFHPNRVVEIAENRDEEQKQDLSVLKETLVRKAAVDALIKALDHAVALKSEALGSLKKELERVQEERKEIGSQL